MTDRVAFTSRLSAFVAAATLFFAGSAGLIAQGPPLPARATNVQRVVHAPEVNPALIVGAVTLVVGGMLILADRMLAKTRKA